MANPLEKRWGLSNLKLPGPDQVYLGNTYNGYQAGAATQNPYVERFGNVTEVSNQWGLLDQKDRDRLKATAARNAGWGADSASRYPEQNMPGFWADTVARAAQVQAAKGVRVQPLDYWDWYYRNNAPQAATGSSGSGGGGGGGAGGGPSVSTSVNLTDPMTAKTVVNQALTTYLGRKAKPQELEKFTAALHANEMANPNVTRSDGGGNSVSSGGGNSQQFAEDWARGREGSSEYLAATSFMDTFINTLKAPVA